VTDFDQAMLDLFKQIGLPDSCKTIIVRMEAGKITTIECKFYPKLNGEYEIDEGLFVTATKLFEVKE